MLRTPYERRLHTDLILVPICLHLLLLTFSHRFNVALCSPQTRFWKSVCKFAVGIFDGISTLHHDILCTEWASINHPKASYCLLSTKINSIHLLKKQLELQWVLTRPKLTVFATVKLGKSWLVCLPQHYVKVSL